MAEDNNPITSISRDIIIFKEIYRETSAGGIQIYESRVENDKILRWTWIEPRQQLDKNGELVIPKKKPKKTEKAILYATTKWARQINECTPHQAAIVKAKNEWKKKIDKGYTVTKPIIEPLPYGQKVKGKKIPARALLELKTPMLLCKYGKKDYPLPPRACISVKRNGVCGFYRVLTDDIVSRRGIQYKHFEHLRLALKRIAIFSNEILINWGYKPRDNDTVIVKAVHMELDMPDGMNMKLQNKMSVFRSQKTKHELNDKVIACIFDLGDQSIVPFYHRYSAMVLAYAKWFKEASKQEKEPNMLNRYIFGFSSSIMLIRCFTVDSDKSMLDSLELAEQDTSFFNWLENDYDAHEEKWEPEKPLLLEELEEWQEGRRKLTREERTRLLHRWMVDELREEGSVIRDMDGYYRGNDYRSQDVLKYKDFEDEEAVVVGYDVGKGAHEGAIVFLLRSLENGMEYSCSFAEVMGYDIEKRRKLYLDYENKKILVDGKVIYTVRFQERHDSGVPQFPVIVSECPLESKSINERSIRDLALEQFNQHEKDEQNRNKKKS